MLYVEHDGFEEEHPGHTEQPHQQQYDLHCVLSTEQIVVRLSQHEHVGECDEQLGRHSRVAVVEGEPLEEDHEHQVPEQTSQEQHLHTTHTHTHIQRHPRQN